MEDWANRQVALQSFERLLDIPWQMPLIKLTETRESPILGYKALREVGRWLGSRRGTTAFPERLGDADAAAATERRAAVGATDPASDLEAIAPRGDK